MQTPFSQLLLLLLVELVWQVEESERMGEVGPFRLVFMEPSKRGPRGC
jgi:hypothetical protein